jgi:hypothetical protein
MKKKDPSLKIRYAQGLGDFIKCILQSKVIYHITEFFIKNSKSCSTCNNRAWALNVLFPIPFWKIYFKTVEEMDKSLLNELLDFGYKISDEEEMQNCNCEEMQNLISNLQNELFSLTDKVNLKNYKEYNLISESETDHDNIKISTSVYKKID